MVTADDPKTLFDFMLSLPDTKRSQVKKWLQVGALTVNEAVQSRHDHVLISGDIVADDIRIRDICRYGRYFAF